MSKSHQNTPETPSREATLIVQGKLIDYIDGVTQRNETPEEYVRQEIAKSLVREYGYPKGDIEIEFQLRVGSRKPRTDIAVFPPGAEHIQERASIVIECKNSKVKAADRREGVDQLKSYLAVCLNADFGMWTNGVERYCHQRVERAGRVEFEEVADIPTSGQDPAESERPQVDQLKPASSDALLFAFRRCHNYIAGNQGLQKPEAFWELLKLIFCKIHDERNSYDLEFYSGAKERHGVNGPLKVKKRIGGLFDAVKKEFHTIFKSNEAIELDPVVLAYLVSQLQIYSLLESDVDVKGRAYEEIVGSNLRGDRGEFFTPRNVCEMAVTMLDPGESDLILDPACGTGGFLITAMNLVIKKISEAERNRAGTEERINRTIRSRNQRFADRNIVGIDLNPNLVKASKMNMVMNNDGSGGLYQGNSLAQPATWQDDLRSLKLMDAIDLLFTNPPFGSKIQIDDPAILEQFDLGHTWAYDAETDEWQKRDELQKSQPPEILFIERCVNLLKPGGGKMAIVLPDGILGSPGLGYVREWILRHTRLLASIDMHPDTFQPHVSVQTSVLVLERKSKEEVRRSSRKGDATVYAVFMALGNHIGHDKRGNRIYVRDDRGNEVLESVDEEVTEYVDGDPVVRRQTTKRKVVDDNTLQIAIAFRQWLSDWD